MGATRSGYFLLRVIRFTCTQKKFNRFRFQIVALIFDIFHFRIFKELLRKNLVKYLCTFKMKKPIYVQKRSLFD